MFRDPVIGIQPSNQTDCSWLSSANCVWNGPQWLVSKQCLKLEVHLGLELLFKDFLKIPHASQNDVVNDLRVLKSYGADEDGLRSQSTPYTQSNNVTASPPYQVTSVKNPSGPPDHFQSITFMETYQKQSFEVKDIAVGKYETLLTSFSRSFV